MNSNFDAEPQNLYQAANMLSVIVIRHCSVMHLADGMDFQRRRNQFGRH
jgi:hypothetical protein